MTSLALNASVMKQSKTAMYIAAAIFMIVGAVIYFRPFLDTVDAFGTAGGVAASKAATVAQQTGSTANNLGATLARVKAVDSKAVAIGLHGVACLNGSLTDGKSCTR